MQASAVSSAGLVTRFVAANNQIQERLPATISGNNSPLVRPRTLAGEQGEEVA